MTRNHSEPNPNTEPPGTPAIMVKYPVRGGFQPLGAKAPDGSPLPHAGTGFGMNQAIAWPSGEPEGPPPYRVNYFRGAEGYQYLEVHQFSYDGQEFRVEKTERVSLTGMFAGWAVLDGAMTNAIPDGEDFLIGVRAEPWDSAKSGRHPWSSPKSGARDAVMRWRREADRWHPVEKQLVLEENWQVLAVVFPPFAQRWKTPYHGLAGPVRCRSEFSTVPTASATAADYIDKRTGNQIWDPESAEPRSTSPFTG